MPKQVSGDPRKRAKLAAEKKAKHQHQEAFALMKYRADDRHLEEILWNSRDGVTPFTLSMRDGSSGTHVDWRNDEYAPDHQPQIGDRIFVDLTVARAHEIATRQAQAIWDKPARADLSYSVKEQFESPEAFAAMLLEGLLQEIERGAPDVVEVTEEMAQLRGWVQRPPRESAILFQGSPKTGKTTIEPLDARTLLDADPNKDVGF
jgi:hypothetical protein